MGEQGPWHLEGVLRVGPVQQFGRRPVERVPGPVLLVDPTGVSRQPPGAAVVLFDGHLERLRVREGLGVHRLADLFAHHRRLAALVVQVEGVGPHAHAVEAVLDDVESCSLLGDEEHSPALGHGAGQQVGDGLRLAGAGRALEHEGASGHGVGDGPQLGAIGWHRAQGRERVQVGATRRVVRVGEGCRRRVDEVRDERVVAEGLPVLVEVLPQPELGELQDRDVRGVLHVVAQAAFLDSHPH